MCDPPQSCCWCWCSCYVPDTETEPLPHLNLQAYWDNYYADDTLFLEADKLSQLNASMHALLYYVNRDWGWLLDDWNAADKNVNDALARLKSQQSYELSRQQVRWLQAPLQADPHTNADRTLPLPAVALQQVDWYTYLSQQANDSAGFGAYLLQRAQNTSSALADAAGTIPCGAGGIVCFQDCPPGCSGSQCPDQCLGYFDV